MDNNGRRVCTFIRYHHRPSTPSSKLCAAIGADMASMSEYGKCQKRITSTAATSTQKWATANEFV